MKIFSFLTPPLCYFICELMLSHLDAASSSVIEITTATTIFSPPNFRKAARMRKFGSTPLRQLLAVKLTAAFSKTHMIDVLPHRRLSDCEYSTEDVYEVSSCPLVVRRNCRCDSALWHHKALHVLMMNKNRALYKFVLRRIQE